MLNPEDTGPHAGIDNAQFAKEFLRVMQDLGPLVGLFRSNYTWLPHSCMSFRT